MSKSAYSLIALILAAILFLAVNIFAANSLQSARLDLTHDKLFTLSEGSLNILGDIAEPVQLRFYFSEKLSHAVPQIRTYALRVREMVEEYATLSQGQIQLQIIDPEPFTEAEDDAVRAGLQAFPLSPSENIYFGLVGTNLVDDQEVISFFQQEREAFLEYELTRLIYNLTDPKHPVVGLLTSQKMKAEISPLMQLGGDPNNQPWAIIPQIRDAFTLQVIDPAAEQLPDNLDILLLVHPGSLSPNLSYAIDQYVLGGGRAVVYVDPLSDVGVALGQQGPGAPTPRSSDLQALFAAWGVALEAGKIVGDWQAAQQVNAGIAGSPKIVRYLAWMQFSPEHFDSDDLIMANLGAITMATPGRLRHLPDAGTLFTPLIQSSEEAMLFDADLFQGQPSPERLIELFEPSGKRYTLAARLSGKAASAFADGPPPVADQEEAEQENAEAEAATAEAASHLAESPDGINVLIVADSDMLFDQFWVRAQDFFGQRVLVPTASNADMLINSLDLMAGSNDLISLRSRGRSTRPFEVVEDLRRDAERVFLDQERQLNAKLDETQQRLSDLQGSAAAGNGALLSTQQQQEIDSAQEEILSTRQQLRAVQRGLNQDIEQLATKLKFANIGLVPILVALIAIVLAVVRFRKRRRDAKQHI